LPVLILLLSVFACDRYDRELSSIHPGLYEIQYNLKYAGQLLILKQIVRYNADGTYQATNFQNNVPYEELRGKYKVEGSMLVSYDIQHRSVVQDGEWIPKEGASVRIRKIKKNSFQYYFEYPNPMMRERYKGLGLSEGWKTYKRLRD